MASIQDIAFRMGISIATVSRALNDKPGVSTELRERVLQMANEIGYRPNIAARSLKTSQTKNIVFAVYRKVFSAEDPFYPFILQGVEETLSRKGYSIVLTTLDKTQLRGDPMEVNTFHHADAIILAGPHIPSAFILALAESGVPVILVDNYLQYSEIPAIMADNRGGCYAVTRHLIEDHGHKHIALIRGPKTWMSSNERASGYMEALFESDLEPLVIEMEDTTIETGMLATEQLLNEHPEVTAIVSVNDAMALGAMRYAKQIGRILPDGLAITGFDDVAWSALNDPSLTTVNIPTVEMGRLTAKMLISQIDGSLTASYKTVVSSEVKIRASCGCRD